MKPSTARTFGKRALGRAFLFGVLLAAGAIGASTVASAGSAEPDAQQLAAYEKSTEGARVHLLIALAKQGQHELADTLLHRFPLTGAYAANRTLYIEGLIAYGRADNTTAVAKYRAALANDPKLTAVRSDLAQTLAEMGEDDSAQHHLKLLEASAPDTETAANIRGLADSLDRNSPFRYSAFVSLAPSTNVNNGSKHKTTMVYSGLFDPVDWDIASDSQRKSGLGASVGANGSYTKIISAHLRGTFGAGARAKVYTDKSFNSYSLNQSADLIYSQQSATVGIGATASESLENDLSGIPYYSFGPRIFTSVNISPRDVISENISLEARRYPHASAINGWATYTDLGWTHTFDQSLQSTISVGMNRVKSKFDPYSYKTWYTGLQLYKEMPKGVTVNLDGQAQFTRFDAFNAAGNKFRKDTRLIGSLGLVKRDWNVYGFAPSVEYTYVRNLSNLKIYDYDSHTFDVRLTKEF